MTTPTYTHITASGLLARIVCTDVQRVDTPILALINAGHEELPVFMSTNLKCSYAGYNLTPLPPYHDFKIDEPVMVRDYEVCDWVPRFFAGASEGKAFTWKNGCTKWTSEGHKTDWLQCRRPTPEELESV